MLLLVRHADAGNKQRWAGPDSLRPLSANGHAEAAGLVVRLEDYPISRVLSSPTLRCSQTVDPLARDRWLPVDHQEALGVDADLAGILALLENPRLADAVLCTHGEVIGQVLTWLVADGWVVDQPLAWPKGSTWLLHGANGRPAHARYLPPLALARPPAWASKPLRRWADDQGSILAPDAGFLQAVGVVEAHLPERLARQERRQVEER
jgi:broad specificity phosphatase PhoE